MTVYVDDAASARPRVFQAFRLSADNQAELHGLAGHLGLGEDDAAFKIHRASSPRCAGGDACVHWHYELTEIQRGQARRLGAKILDWETMCGILSAPRFAEALAANRAAGLRRPPGHGPCWRERAEREQGYRVVYAWMMPCVRCGMITAQRDTDGMAWCGGDLLLQVGEVRGTVAERLGPDPAPGPAAPAAAVPAIVKRRTRYNPALQRHSWTRLQEHHKRCGFCLVHVVNCTRNQRDWWQDWTWPDGRTGTNEGDAKPKLPRCPGPTVEETS